MGFRPGRKARDAVKLARGFGEEGRRWVVDIDLEKFFDRVNHDILMARVARKVKDKRALRLIRAFLEAGIMVDGVAMRREEGTPQGGPLSPLLANIMLDDLDKELERRGHKFARYADDCNICVSSRRAGERVLASVRQFLEDRLKLKVNEAKSGVVRPWKSKFLGFTVYTQKGMSLGIRVAPKTLKRVKDKLRELTDRNRSENLEQRIVKVNDYIRGWIAYFALADAKKMLAALHGWVCRRLRACVWKQWKRVRTRIREMRALGFPDWKVFGWANDRRGPWAIAGTTLNSILPASYWRKLGLVHFVEFYEEHRQT
jgi:RNA-directed DNA polymerase